MDSERVRFSKHATQRLMVSARLPESQEILKLGEAMDRASAKGCRSSLILSRDMAYIVNVPSRTVVTAIDAERLKESVFTQIDSTVIL
jgi:flagellar operon protein